MEAHLTSAEAAEKGWGSVRNGPARRDRTRFIRGGRGGAPRLSAEGAEHAEDNFIKTLNHQFSDVYSINTLNYPFCDVDGPDAPTDGMVTRHVSSAEFAEHAVVNSIKTLKYPFSDSDGPARFGPTAGFDDIGTRHAFARGGRRGAPHFIRGGRGARGKSTQ